jgi:hypothetical protein
MDRPVKAYAGGIDPLGVEDVRFFERDKGSSGFIGNQQVTRRIGLGSGGWIKFEAAKDQIAIRNFVIDSRGNEVLRCDVRGGLRVISDISIPQKSQVR